MKNLKLTILLDNQVNKSELANVFGNFKELRLSNRYLQFTFPNIQMLNRIQLLPIINLIESYEARSSKLTSKILHLVDDKTNLPSPNYILCLKGDWQIIETNTNIIRRSGSSFTKIF